MKKFLLAMVTALFLSFAPTTLSAEEEVVHIPDPVLRDIVKENLQLNSDEEITRSKLKELNSMRNMQWYYDEKTDREEVKFVKTFEGLEDATNIEYFNYYIPFGDASYQTPEKLENIDQYVERKDMMVYVDPYLDGEVHAVTEDAEFVMDYQNFVLSFLEKLSSQGSAKSMFVGAVGDNYDFLIGTRPADKKIDFLQFTLETYGKTETIDYIFNGYENGEKTYLFQYNNDYQAVYLDDTGTISLDEDYKYVRTFFSADDWSVSEHDEFVQNKMTFFNKEGKVLELENEAYYGVDHFQFILTESELKEHQGFEIQLASIQNEKVHNYVELAQIETYFVIGEEIETYRVDFDSNGGSEVDAIEGIEAGNKIQQPQDPEKEGYTFEGWYTSDDFKTAWRFDEDTVQENMTLYAKWEKVVEEKPEPELPEEKPEPELPEEKPEPELPEEKPEPELPEEKPEPELPEEKPEPELPEEKPMLELPNEEPGSIVPEESLPQTGVGYSFVPYTFIIAGLYLVLKDKE